MFAWFTTLHAIYTGVLDLVFLIENSGPQNQDKQATLTIAMGLLAFSALISLCVGGLGGYHGKLAINGQTTNEEMRGKYGNGNPYDHGWRSNCRAFCDSGTSRIFDANYDTERLSIVEANVFVLKSKLPANYNKK